MPIPSTRLHTIACTCDRCRPLTPRHQLLIRVLLGFTAVLAGALLSYLA